MSTTEFKAGFVAELPELTNMLPEDIVEWFTERCGEPEVEQYGGELHIYYGRSHWQVVSPYKGSPWKIALWASYERDYGSMFVINAVEFDRVCDWFASTFGVHIDTVQIVAYEYYNGTDDPLNMDEMKNHTGSHGYDMSRFPEGIKV